MDGFDLIKEVAKKFHLNTKSNSGVTYNGSPYFILCDLTLTANGKDTTRENQKVTLTMDSSSASMNVSNIKGDDPYWFSKFDLRYMENISFDGNVISFDGDAHNHRPYRKYHLSVSNIRKSNSPWP